MHVILPQTQPLHCIDNCGATSYANLLSILHKWMLIREHTVYIQFPTLTHSFTAFTAAAFFPAAISPMALEVAEQNLLQPGLTRSKTANVSISARSTHPLEGRPRLPNYVIFHT